jgi:alkylhydroperoxidase/carboxymuconolactone decarboxylase family protein YurZ
MDDAALDRYAEALHRKRVDRAAEAGDRPSFIPDPWEDRPEHLKEIDRSMASVVAAMAVHDAGLENIRMRAQLFAFTTHRPAIFNALRAAVAGSGTEAVRKHYRAALEALGGKEEES